ncbi:MAG TPA: 3-oxoacyl-[acyl-carrier-protein] synthase III C-terminal domain-containing protein [Streptosporangiaceae bacterium]|nr:3-oxoacyl-[acyl-carrier-protein] synthase III C-terminal domain-containing protein [Streptosporangiaceae bacterium]
MTAIEAVATYLPDQRVSIEDLAGRLGLRPIQIKLFRRFLGLSQIRLDPAGTLLDLLLAGAAGLDALRGREHQVRYVLYARTLPVVVPYPLNPLHELCRALGLDRAVAFTVTHHACATSLLAVDIAGRLLAADGEPDALALVLTGEKTFTRDAQLVPGTSIFGEGAAACLVRADGHRDRLLSYATATKGEFDGRLEDLPELAARYEQEYPDSLAEVLLAAVAQAGLTLEEISLILPHNVNVVSWQRLSRKIGFPVDRVLLDNVPVTGHAFCADSFLNYATARDRGLLRPGDRYLIAAAGLGATFSAMVFEH